MRWAALVCVSVMCAVGCSGGAEPWKAKLPDIGLSSSKGEKATLLSELKPGPYQPSTVAIGEEQDLARQRAQPFGFVRQARLEEFLSGTRAKLLAVSGKTGVPGQVRIVASQEFNAYSTADGNVYISMRCIEELQSLDEVAAILAHEMSHVLLTHHTADLFADVQHRGRALYELGLDTKNMLNGTKKSPKGDRQGRDTAETVVRVTDKLVLPAWTRGQEKEADLLGVDLLVEAGYSPVAMISMLEKLRAWERTDEQRNNALLAQIQETGNQSWQEKGRVIYKDLLDRVAVNHPKTEERINETAAYLERHYGSRTLAEPRAGPWTALVGRPDVKQVMINYKLAFAAQAALETGKDQEAYSAAKKAAAGPTAADAYPNVVLSRAADALGHHPEAVSALVRAVNAKEPVALVYQELIDIHERSGNIKEALGWTDKASRVFADDPQWRPHKIRLLRKAGRVAEAAVATQECSLKTPDWKSLCERANRT
ncbi:MAG TPA: M48 family metallopeptidase [Vicinamibacteria bacterium]|nr:M48 family metallopeptidase [Vicinamibacteria bacterium]